MAIKFALERLFGWIRSRSAPQRVDPADVGTAYGMELSLGPAEGSERAKHTDKASDPVAPRPGAAKRGRR
jgi:hypothetical protein